MHQLQAISKPHVYSNRGQSYQLAKVVYLVTEESSNTKVVCSAQPVFRCKILNDVDTGEVKERVFVIRPIFCFGLGN